MSEGAATVVGAVRRHGIDGHRVGNIDREAPIAVAVEVIGLASCCLYEAQHAAVYVGYSFSLQLLAQMVGDCFDVVLQQFHIGEVVVVDALQYVVGLIGFGSRYQEGVVDKPVA